MARRRKSIQDILEQSRRLQYENSQDRDPSFYRERNSRLTEIAWRYSQNALRSMGINIQPNEHPIRVADNMRVRYRPVNREDYMGLRTEQNAMGLNNG